jgi:ribulose-phosphate 3-epimerase
MYTIAPSILSADLGKLAEEIKAVEEAGADYIHIDVMDGQFVPNITVGPLIVRAARRITQLPLDVHLMIDRPERYISDFVEAGASILSIHPEACVHLQRTLHTIRSLGGKSAVALNPSTPLCSLDHVLDDVDMILIMTVNPGFPGQSFIPGMIPKVKTLTERLKRERVRVPIEVDGGIGPRNVGEVARAGAEIFVAGSAIYNTDNYKETMRTMRDEISRATEGVAR